MKKFSILLPCFNGEKYLEQAIRSILDQDYKNWELIIIDGNSTDGTHAIINRYCQLDKRIIWLKYDSSNFSAKLNHALMFAQGEIIGYIGFDDYYRQGIFKEVAHFLESHQDCLWLYGNSYNVYPYAKSKLLFIKPPKKYSYHALFLSNFVGLQNCFFDKNVLVAAKFSEENKYSQDYELWFRLIKICKPVYINAVVSYNTQDNNLSSGPMSGAQRLEAQALAWKNAKTILQKTLAWVGASLVLGPVIYRLYKLFIAM